MASGSQNLTTYLAKGLAHRILNQTSLDGLSGTHAFSGSGEPWAGSDWVGLQIGDSVDKFQIAAKGNTLLFRQNDSGGTNTSWQSWVTMLTSSNYNDYAPTKTGGGASGTWGISITGNAVTATKATQDADGQDIRNRYFRVYNTSYIGNSDAVTVNDLAAQGPAYGMINSATDNPTGGATWVHVLNMAWGKTNGSWIGQIALNTNGAAMYFRGNGSSAISGKGWNTVLSSNNYTSWTVTKTGSGASGTWGISISGSSASCTGNSATATALTSNAGGGEQPIYFTGGKPAATSYALKATVNNGDAPYVAYYSGGRVISSAKAASNMVMPAHYYHNLYNNNPTTGTTVYVHYYNGDTTSTNTFANLRVKSGSTYKVLAFGGDGTFTWNGTSVVTNSGTWGISITGNAATATNADKLDGLHANQFAKSMSPQRTFNDIAQNENSALGMIYTDTGPESGNSWYHFIQMNYNNNVNGSGNTSNFWCAQIANKPGATNPYIRSRSGGNDISTGWSAWARILTSTNYSSWCAAASHTHDYMLTSWRRENVIACYKGVDQNLNTAGYWGAMSTQTNGLPGDWWHILSMDWSGNDPNNWISQLAILTAGRTGVYYRSQNGTAISSVGWKKLWTQGESITSAVWNDYAEARTAQGYPGQVVYELGDDTCISTIERLQHFAGIISDTWGFSQGETDNAKTHIAVAGRVLAYTYRNRDEYKPGDVLCAAPGGTVDIMTREEIIQYPDRIVGTVSCVPDYDEWGGGEDADRPPVKVNGRIWVKVR